MARTNNNKNFWKKVVDTDFPNDDIYETSFLLKKYGDLSNKQQKELGRLYSKVNASTGDVTVFERIKGLNTVIQIRDKDGKVDVKNDFLNEKYFSATDVATFSQYENVLSESHQKVLDESFKKFGTLNYFKNARDYKSDVKNFFTDPLDLGFDLNTGYSIDGQVSANPYGIQDQNAAAFTRKDYPISNNKLLRYPKEVPTQFGYDFIRITAYEYTAGGRSSLSLGAGRQSAKERLIKDAKKLETVILPMQPNFSESNAVSWGGDMIDPLQMLMGKAAAGGIDAVSKIIGLDATGASNAIGSVVNDLGNDIKNVINDSATGPAIIAYFAGRAVGANILGRSAGVTLNPNLELLFKGPNLRTFAFNFRFTPRSGDEAQEVKQIIRTFKKNMAVQRSTSNLFLLTPNVFSVEYIYNSDGPNAGETHPYLNIFKPMALQSFNVNYTPDGSYMTYEDGSLTQYDVQMSFGEIEPIYADEYDGGDAGDFNSHNNMGY